MAKYLVYATKARETGATIQLYDTRSPENTFKATSRWVIYCADHETAATRSFEKQAEAFKVMTRPTEWCEGCKEVAERGEKVMKGEAAHSRSQERRLEVQTRSTREKAPEKLTVEELLQANICFNVDKGVHPLKAPDGHYHQTAFPVNNICCQCAGHD